MKNKKKVILMLLSLLLPGSLRADDENIKTPPASVKQILDTNSKKLSEPGKNIKKSETNLKKKKINRHVKDGLITGGVGAGVYFICRLIAHEFLFMGDSSLGESRFHEEHYYLFNELRDRGKITERKVDSKRLGLPLRGYVLNELQPGEEVKNVCILFHGNAIDSQLDISIAHLCHAKNTVFVSFEYPSRRFYGTEGTLWWMNEKDFRDYAEDVYDFVKQEYFKDGKKPKIITRGWNLGGYPASYLANKDDVSCVILDSPVCLPAITGIMTYPLFGFDLDSVKNILNTNRTKPLDLIMRSGGKKDSLSLYYTLPQALGKELKDKENIKNEFSQKVQAKNINLKQFEIADGGKHGYFGFADSLSDIICTL